jgi:hypothetical protein
MKNHPKGWKGERQEASFRSTALMFLLLTSHGTELSHMAIRNCKGLREISSHPAKINFSIIRYFITKNRNVY